MGKVIHTDTPGKKRDKIMRLLATVMARPDLLPVKDLKSKDMMSFVYLSLVEVEKTINETVRPWEKREYWVKADAFREDWAWVKDLLERLLIKFNTNNWQSMDQEIEALREKLSSIDPLKRIDQKEFWKGAYQTLNERILRK
jgi:hypothetical protein